MTTKPELQRLLDDLAQRLSQTLSPVDTQNGWTVDAQQAIGLLIADLRVKLATGKELPHISLSRGLDSWGILGGDLAEATAVLSNAMREFTIMK